MLAQTVMTRIIKRGINNEVIAGPACCVGSMKSGESTWVVCSCMLRYRSFGLENDLNSIRQICIS